MIDAERFLEPDCDELPVCRCGKEMYIASTRSSPKMADVDIRIYNCATCEHEMHLAIWRADPAAASDIRTADTNVLASVEHARKMALINEWRDFYSRRR
jgi:hypothetical protein